MDDAQLLSELEHLLRTMPPRESLRLPTEVNQAWLGRASGIVAAWNGPPSLSFSVHMDTFLSRFHALEAASALGKIMTILQQARWDLRMKTAGPLAVVVNRGQPFDYFDEVRKLVAAAQTDIHFVDPYLDAEFVSRYLPHVRSGVTVRLLTSKKLSVLLPAVQQFAQQSGLSIEVRRPTARPHDRYVFIDRAQCYLSSATFQDGGSQSPATLQQISDSFTELSQIYEGEWTSATIERSP